MRVTGFEWDEHNIRKPLKHGVEIDEVESVFFNQPTLFLNSHSGRYIALGRTDEGRYLTVIFQYKKSGIVRPVTARKMTEPERKYFKRRS
ncbi:MAG: BrnT family toxin [Peptococcaceae bacterium]